jgi:hypothetical protein
VSNVAPPIHGAFEDCAFPYSARIRGDAAPAKPSNAKAEIRRTKTKKARKVRASRLFIGMNKVRNAVIIAQIFDDGKAGRLRPCSAASDN